MERKAKQIATIPYNAAVGCIDVTPHETFVPSTEPETLLQRPQAFSPFIYSNDL